MTIEAIIINFIHLANQESQNKKMIFSIKIFHKEFWFCKSLLFR